MEKIHRMEARTQFHSVQLQRVHDAMVDISDDLVRVGDEVHEDHEISWGTSRDEIRENHESLAGNQPAARCSPRWRRRRCDWRRMKRPGGQAALQ